MQTVSDQTTEYDVPSEMLEVKRKRIRKEQYRSDSASSGSQSKRGAQGGDMQSRENRTSTGYSRGGQAGQSGQSRSGSGSFSEHSTKNRRLRKQATPKELENLHRYNNSKSFRIKKARKNAFALFLRRALICLIFYAIMLSSSFLLFKSTLSADNTPATSDYIYQVGSDSNIYSRKYLPWDKVRVGETMYLNMTEIAKYCSMTVTGDSTQLRFITRDGSGEHVSFMIDSEIAYVNNVEVRMTGASFMSEDELYVPMSFVSGYMLGINVSYDSTKNKITVQNDPGTDKISFSLKDPVGTDPIDWDSIGYEIRDQILKSMAAASGDQSGNDGTTTGSSGNGTTVPGSTGSTGSNTGNTGNTGSTGNTGNTGGTGGAGDASSASGTSGSGVSG